MKQFNKHISFSLGSTDTYIHLVAVDKTRTKLDTVGGNHGDRLTTSSWGETHTFLLWEILKPHPNVKDLLPSLSPKSYILQLFFICVKYCNIKARAEYGISNQTVSWMYHFIPDSVSVATEDFFFFPLTYGNLGEKKKYGLTPVERQESYQHQQPELLLVRSGSLLMFFVTNIIWVGEHTVSFKHLLFSLWTHGITSWYCVHRAKWNSGLTHCYYKNDNYTTAVHMNASAHLSCCNSNPCLI